MIGNLIKQARIEKNISQLELAEKVGIKRQSLYRIENEMFAVRGDIFERLADALDMEIVLIPKIKNHGQTN